MSGILQGIKVVDFGKYIAGPLCAGMLADLGADVVRVEKPGGGDDRYVAPATDSGEGSLFLYANRGKRSLTLDTGKPEGLAVLHRLIAQADIVIANLSPSALAHFGLDYASVRALREDIILVTSSAFPSDTPMKDALGFDSIGQVVSGGVFLTGEPGRPYKSATAYVDFGTAVSSAYAAMAALFNRERTGKGMHVESSLVGTALNVMAPILMEHAYGKAPRSPTGNRSPIGGPSDIVKAKDGWFVVSVLGDKLFSRWAKFVGRPELAQDPRFANDALRGLNGAELSQVMTEWAMEKTTDECIRDLAHIGLPAGPVLSPDEIMAGAMGLRDSFFRDGAFGSESVLQMPTPIRFSGASTRKNIDAPALGQHSREVLADYGFAAAEVERLIEMRLV